MELIREYSKEVSHDFCDRVIEEFEKQHKLGCTRTRHDNIRRDNQINLNEYESNFRNSELSEEFFKEIQAGVDEYIQELGLQNIFADGLWFKDMLVQRNKADNFEAYSTWHCEASTKLNTDRALTYVLYLNDDYKGGETQFMYQKLNVKPQKGKLVFFPASFTHVHRGNMITEGTKYIITGWCFY